MNLDEVVYVADPNEVVYVADPNEVDATVRVDANAVNARRRLRRNDSF